MRQIPSLSLLEDEGNKPPSQAANLPLFYKDDLKGGEGEASAAFDSFQFLVSNSPTTSPDTSPESNI